GGEPRQHRERRVGGGGGDDDPLDVRDRQRERPHEVGKRYVDRGIELDGNRAEAKGGDGDRALQDKVTYRGFSATNLLRSVPMPVMSTSTTSPAFRSGEVPSVPIQITSPAHRVKYFVLSGIN